MSRVFQLLLQPASTAKLSKYSVSKFPTFEQRHSSLYGALLSYRRELQRQKSSLTNAFEQRVAKSVQHIKLFKLSSVNSFN
jgi:hypothetical protein